MKDGIRFTTASDWTATVTEVPVAKSDQTAQTVEWITLSAYSGGAGEHTLTMTVRGNNTGKARKAKIVIRCGATEITVTVEQKADKTDGTVTVRYETDAAGYVTKIFSTWTREGEPAGEECLAWEIEYE